MNYSSFTYIVIVNYGNWQDTVECIESIKGNCQNYKIVLIDVVNKDNSIKELRNNVNIDDDFIHFIELDKNNGFAYANNIGIKYSIEQEDCKYIWLLNNDTIINSNTLSSLHTCYQKNDEIAFLGSKILDYYDKNIIQTIGGKFNHKTGYSILIGMGEKDNGQYDKKDNFVDYVIGASMFFDKELINKIGLMPEEYFLYYEDVDWCLTAKRKGFYNSVCTESVVFHKQGKSTGNIYFANKKNLNTAKYLYINYLKLYRKHFPKKIHIAYLILFKQFMGRLIKFKCKEACIILQAIFK